VQTSANYTNARLPWCMPRRRRFTMARRSLRLVRVIAAVYAFGLSAVPLAASWRRPQLHRAAHNSGAWRCAPTVPS
jgi:hypothetical protein